ncbi:hypothetical protein [Lachnoclostridium phytofermentans]|uniref:hypothetical protein n=1 Tax=Lachnoclostridium phytofermentans TaxID=66219 RepID=UPI000495F98C|nr:hypothetical protein [Lachnoclostridium phytofermentans]
MHEAFNDAKYTEATEKAIAFIKRQMDVNNFVYQINFAMPYEDAYSGNVIYGTVTGLNDDLDQIFPLYINVPSYYDYSYRGKVSGTWHDVTDYTDYAVNVYVLQDAEYKVITCPLKADGTWESTMDYKETYTVPVLDAEGLATGETTEEVVTYTLDVSVDEGIKEFRLARNLSSRWETISTSSDLIVERLVYDATEEISAEDGGYAYRYFSFFTIGLYSYSDAEYTNAICKIWNVGGGIYVWYTNHVAVGHKIAKLLQQVWREGNFHYDVVGIAGSITNLQTGRLPASFFIPADDPQYNKDGSSALGVYGYLLNSRTWAYDVGLALLVFTTSGDYDLCKEMLNRMVYEQNTDGSFNFSYDIYIGQIFDGYVRTGAMGWLVWGACYYTLESGDRSYVDMIEKAGNWILSKQINDKDDMRYGLITGGYGTYHMEDYSYTADEMEWCSVEHQCSALQAIEGCALVFKDMKYKKAAELVRERLYLTCYDKNNCRFYQGINSGKPDEAWALDCTTWAGMLAFSIVHDGTAKDCLATAKEVYLTTGKSIVKSSESDYYNMTYSSSDTFSGFKPYSDRTADYTGAPDLVWTEGTLGYAALALMLGHWDEARIYVDECINLQNCDGSTGGVIYTTATYGMLPWEFHVWESVVSSAWLYLIIHNPDVLFPKTLRQVYYMAKIGNIHDERPSEN